MGNMGRILNLLAGSTKSTVGGFLDGLENSKSGRAALAEIETLNGAPAKSASETALDNVRSHISGMSTTESGTTPTRLSPEEVAKRQLADLRAGRTSLATPKKSDSGSTATTSPAANTAPDPQVTAEHPILTQIREQIDSGKETETAESISRLIQTALQGNPADEIALLRCVETYARFFTPDHLQALRSTAAADRGFVKRALRDLGTANPDLSIRARTL